MHRVFFTTKRFWLAAVRYYWHRWAKLGLTHARYDFLLVVEPKGEAGATQAEIARTLGVSSAAASKMGKLLERLKLIRRDYVINRRTLSLRLTEKGKKAFERAREKVTGFRFAQGILESAFHEHRDRFLSVGDALCDLETLAHGYGAPVVEEFVYPGPYPHGFLLANSRLRREAHDPRTPVSKPSSPRHGTRSPRSG